MKSSPPINIKLIQGISILSQKELKEFVFFATSRYFSGQRSYSNILKVLKALHKINFYGHDNNSLSNHLMNELKLSKNTLSNRMSELYKIFEMFVVIRQLKHMRPERNNILMKYYSDNNSFKLFDYVYNSSSEFLKKSKTSANKIKNEYTLYDLSSTNFFMQGKSKSFTEHYSLRSEYHIYGFLTDLLKNCIEILQQNFMGLNKATGMPVALLNELPVKKILESLKKINREYYDLILIIHKMYLSFNDYTEIKNFRSALKIHKKIKSNLSNDDNQYVYLLFITYCINQTHFNKDEFFNHLFGIIREKLKDGYFEELTENNFPVNNFRDYVFIGLRVGDTEWVRSFVKTYSHYLPSEYRKDDICIANAMIASKEKRFEEALVILKKIRKKNYLHYTDSAFHRLRAYYELKHFADALAEIERIKKYFKSNKNMPAIFHKKYSQNLKDIEILFKYSEGKIDKNDFKLYFSKYDKILKGSWVGDLVIRVLNEK